MRWTLRVERLPGGVYSLTTIKARVGGARFTSKLPKEVARKMAILSMVDDGDEIEDVGYRYSATVFYIRGEGSTRQ